jgi:hypothetical protein
MTDETITAATILGVGPHSWGDNEPTNNGPAVGIFLNRHTPIFTGAVDQRRADALDMTNQSLGNYSRGYWGLNDSGE